MSSKPSPFLNGAAKPTDFDPGAKTHIRISLSSRDTSNRTSFSRSTNATARYLACKGGFSLTSIKTSSESSHDLSLDFIVTVEYGFGDLQYNKPFKDRLTDTARNKYEMALANPIMARAFIEDYGTHFPVRVSKRNAVNLKVTMAQRDSISAYRFMRSVTADAKWFSGSASLSDLVTSAADAGFSSTDFNLSGDIDGKQIPSDKLPKIGDSLATWQDKIDKIIDDMTGGPEGASFFEVLMEPYPDIFVGDRFEDWPMETLYDKLIELEQGYAKVDYFTKDRFYSYPWIPKTDQKLLLDAKASLAATIKLLNGEIKAKLAWKEGDPPIELSLDDDHSVVIPYPALKVDLFLNGSPEITAQNVPVLRVVCSGMCPDSIETQAIQHFCDAENGKSMYCQARNGLPCSFPMDFRSPGSTMISYTGLPGTTPGWDGIMYRLMGNVFDFESGNFTAFIAAHSRAGIKLTGLRVVAKDSRGNVILFADKYW